MDLHEDWLDKLDDIPTLSIPACAIQLSPRGTLRISVAGNLKAQINARIQGGTGLAPAVEQALWDRARDRETTVALARSRK